MPINNSTIDKNIEFFWMFMPVFKIKSTAKITNIDAAQNIKNGCEVETDANGILYKILAQFIKYSTIIEIK